MNKETASNDIDLLEIFLTIINNKMRIVLIVVLTIAVTFGIKINKRDVEFKRTIFTTEFGPISIINEFHNYRKINLNIDSSIITLNRLNLYDLFTRILEQEIDQLIKDFNFIKIEDYENVQEYDAAIEEILGQVEINEPGEDDDLPNKLNWNIKFTTKSEYMSKKWKEFLGTVEYSSNRKVKKYLQELMNNTLKSAKFEKQIALEKVEIEIENAIINYELEINSRLSFLKEQARIAREGNVESENVTTSSFGYNYSINYNEDALSLYYLKGYRVIEKEIELISKRKNAYLFVKSIPGLEAKKLKIENSQDINRMEAQFNETPIFDDEKVFLAGKIISNTNKIKIFNRVKTASATAFIGGSIGLIIAMFYIIILNILQSSMKHKRKK